MIYVVYNKDGADTLIAPAGMSVGEAQKIIEETYRKEKKTKSNNARTKLISQGFKPAVCIIMPA